MGSIRPLITITILGAVGVYLYTKINEGPVPNARLTNAVNQPPDGVPPLAATKGASLSTDSNAPAWPSSAPTVTPAPTTIPVARTDPPANKSTANNSGAATPNTAKTSATVPTIPDLPELPPLPNATSALKENPAPI